MPFDPDKAIALLDSTISAKESKKPTVLAKENKRPVTTGKPRPFFGLPPEMEKTLFPRAVETRERGGGEIRTAIPGALDAISLPLRAIASLPALVPGGETYKQALGRTGGKKRKGIGKVLQFGGDIIRDPTTVLLGGVSLPAKMAGKPIAQKMAVGAVKGAVEQSVPAVVRQSEIASRTGEVDVKDALKDIGGELAFSGIGSGVGGQLFREGATKLGKKFFSSVAKTKDVTAKLAGKDVAKGLEEIASDIVSYNLESPTGGFKTMAKKATNRIAEKSKALDDSIDAFVKAHGDELIDMDEVFIRFMDDIQKGKENLFFASEENAVAILDNIYKALELRKLTGEQPITNIRKIKGTLKSGLKLFKKGKFGIGDDPIKAQVGELVELKIGEQLNKYIPDAKSLNEDMRRLYTTRRALMEAEKRTANHNFLSLRTMILASAGLGGGSMQTLGAGLAASAILGVPAKGRGASALIRIGRGGVFPTTGRVAGVSIKRLEDLNNLIQNGGVENGKETEK